MPFSIGEVEVVNEVSLAPSAVLYDGAVTADGDLTIKVNGFYYELAGTHGHYLGSCGNSVTNNQTNYVYLDYTGSLTINTTGYPASAHIRLARVVAQSGIIVRIILERAFFTSAGSAISEAAKSGILIPGNFSGNPKKATVTFGSSYPDTNYSITLATITDGTKGFASMAESKTKDGFVVNLHSNNVANLVEVGWHTMTLGS